jgi:hypothetical protein
MRNSAIVLLQIAVACLGLGAIAFLLWEPHVEGRNAHATVFEIYFKDPFLAYVYLGSTPFFIALHRAFKLLSHLRHTGAVSQVTVEGLGTIRRCALTLIGFIAGAEVYIVVAMRGKEDIAGGVMMGLVLMSACAVTAVAAAVLERMLQNALGPTSGKT